MQKVKFSQVIGQGDEGEVPQLEFDELGKMHKVLQEVKGPARGSQA